MSTKEIAINGLINGQNKIPIRQFDLSYMVENPAIVMVAKRGSGKSFVCKSIINYLKEIPIGIIISPTERMDRFYGDFFPDSFIYYDYKSEIILKLLARQTMIKEKNEELNKKGKKIDTRAFIIMDDCLSSKKTWINDQPILELLYNGRHYDITYILTMQYSLGIQPELRNQFDYIFLFAEEIRSNLKRIYDHYAGMFPTFDSFSKVFPKLTESFCSMVIVNTNRKSSLPVTDGGGGPSSFINKIFWYKAFDVNINAVGCKQFIEYHKKHYDKDWRKKQCKFDIEEFCLLKKRKIKNSC